MRIDEKKLNFIIENAIVRELLTEDQVSDSIAKAVALVMSKWGRTKEDAEKWVRENLRSMYPALRTKRGGKFILGVTRIEMSFESELIKDTLNDIIHYISIKRDGRKDDYYNLFDKNLNGLSGTSLMDMFEDVIEQEYARSRQDVETNHSSENINEEYTIIPISSFEEASKYSQYTSWCVTQGETAFIKYSKRNTCQFYFCLKKGFEDVPKVAGENSPLDEYGLSMLAVCVHPNGKLKTCTCRWNHDQGGGDNVMTAEDISKTLHCNFYSVFKPNENWKNVVVDIKNRIKNGEDPNVIFPSIRNLGDGYKAGRTEQEMWFILDPNDNLLSDMFFDDIDYSFKGGCLCVKTFNKRLFLTTKGELIPKTKYVRDIVNLCKEYEERGEEIPLSLFSKTYQEVDGSIRVTILGGLHNIIVDGKLKFNNFYSYISKLRDKENDKVFYLARRNYNDNYVVLDENEQDVFGISFLTVVGIVYNDGELIVKTEKGYNVLSLYQPKKFRSKLFFKTEIKLVNGKKFRFVGIPVGKTTANCYNANGDKFFEHDVDTVTRVVDSGEIFYVQQNEKYNIIGADGKIMLDEWYDEMEQTYWSNYLEKPIQVEKDGKINYISLQTKTVISPIWFDEGEKFYLTTDVAKVGINGKFNLINARGEMVLNQSYDNIQTCSYGIYILYKNGEGYNAYSKYTQQLVSDYPLYSITYDEKESNFVILKTENSEPIEIEGVYLDHNHFTQNE